MPITRSEFEKSLGEVTFPLCVAVSGGADSLALLLLAHEVAQERGSHVIALTVNHNLRAEAKEEALQVKKWANARGIEHEILEWNHDHPTARLQEKARKARYDLLTQWCKDHQISTLLLGHHQQDQEETFWLRLSSGSGLDGLSGMKKRIVRDGVLFLRPLLDFPKGRIKETLLAYNQEWIEDPSNQSPRFFRGRLRQFLSEEGLSSLRLCNTMNKLQQDADFIQKSLRRTLEETVQMHEGGYLSLKKAAFQTLHPALTERLLSLVVQWYTSRPYAPRRAQISSVMDKINQGASFTMGGIYWVMTSQDIVLFRERRAVKDVLSLDQLHEPTLWDQRFWVDPGIKKFFPLGTIIKALGNLEHAVHPSTSALRAYAQDERCGGPKINNGNDAPLSPFVLSVGPVRTEVKGSSEKRGSLLTSLPKECWNSHNDDADVIPKQAWPTLPALWEKGNVVAVPHLCYDLLKCGTDLRKFIYLKPLFTIR